MYHCRHSIMERLTAQPGFKILRVSYLVVLTQVVENEGDMSLTPEQTGLPGTHTPAIHADLILMTCPNKTAWPCVTNLTKTPRLNNGITFLRRHFCKQKLLASI